MAEKLIRVRLPGLALPEANGPRCLSDLKNRSEKGAERGQILTISPGNSGSIAQENGEIWTAQRLLQPISFKSDRLLGQPLSMRVVACRV